MKNRKHIMCPACGFKRIVDSNINTKSVVVPLSRAKEQINAFDYFLKCPKCKEQIGLRTIANR